MAEERRDGLRLELGLISDSDILCLVEVASLSSSPTYVLASLLAGLASLRKAQQKAASMSGASSFETNIAAMLHSEPEPSANTYSPTATVPSPLVDGMCDGECQLTGDRISDLSAGVNIPCERSSGFKLLIKLGSMGVFYMFVEPGCSIAQLMIMIEKQAAELYRIIIRVMRLHDMHGVDLAPSYLVESLVEENAMIMVHYDQLQNVTGKKPVSCQTKGLLLTLFFAAVPEHRDQAHIQQAWEPTELIIGYTRSEQSPIATHPLIEAPRDYVMFVEQPPSHVRQKQEFHCIIRIDKTIMESMKKGRVNEPSSDGDPYDWLRLDVYVEHQGARLDGNAYKAQRKFVNEATSTVVFLITIRQNSYYRKRPFYVVIRVCEPFADLAVVHSRPIYVASKKRRGKTSY